MSDDTTLREVIEMMLGSQEDRGKRLRSPDELPLLPEDKPRQHIVLPHHLAAALMTFLVEDLTREDLRIASQKPGWLTRVAGTKQHVDANDSKGLFYQMMMVGGFSEREVLTWIGQKYPEKSFELPPAGSRELDDQLGVAWDYFRDELVWLRVGVQNKPLLVTCFACDGRSPETALVLGENDTLTPAIIKDILQDLARRRRQPVYAQVWGLEMMSVVMPEVFEPAE